jgi:hypothetical protein
MTRRNDSQNGRDTHVLEPGLWNSFGLRSKRYPSKSFRLKRCKSQHSFRYQPQPSTSTPMLYRVRNDAHKGHISHENEEDEENIIRYVPAEDCIFAGEDLDLDVDSLPWLLRDIDFSVRDSRGNKTVTDVTPGSMASSSISSGMAVALLCCVKLPEIASSLVFHPTPSHLP